MVGIGNLTKGKANLKLQTIPDILIPFFYCFPFFNNTQNDK